MASLYAGNLILLWALMFFCIAAAAAASSSSSSSAPIRFTIKNAYPAIFVFGDSLSDAGNGAIAHDSDALKTTQLPYGETFPGWPTGRFSDGHTLIDCLAAYMGLPLLHPYLNSTADFEGGVNYAVGGATGFNTSFLSSLGISTVTNLSLDVQLSWHLAFKESVESSNGSQAGASLEAAFVEGLYVFEIGGNDYIQAYAANNPPSFVNSTMIPLVIEKIHSVVETLLDSGAENFLFVSITPLGCSPTMLVHFDGIKDMDGCLEEYNMASYLHGVLLQEEVAKLRTLYPSATFLFMDYYGAYTYVFKHKETFGFVENMKACCGAGDDYPYNFNPLDECNINSISVCPDPSIYILWDGIHFTNSFNLQIFNQTFITGSYLDILHSPM